MNAFNLVEFWKTLWTLQVLESPGKQCFNVCNMYGLIAGVSYIYRKRAPRTCRCLAPPAPGRDRRHVPADVRRRYLADIRRRLPASGRPRYSLTQLGMLRGVLLSQSRIPHVADGQRRHENWNLASTNSKVMLASHFLRNSIDVGPNKR